MGVRSQTEIAVESIIREEWGRVLAALMGVVRDLELAEDVLQDSVVVALQRWPKDGVPDNPRAWLLKTARHKAIDRFRRDQRLKRKQAEMDVLAELERLAMPEETDTSIKDERLRLIFTCCHPALGKQTRIALTLRTVAGLTTAEIARAFLIPETTMAQRLVRAKRKIKSAVIPYRTPPPHLWDERIDSVLSVIYLVFNEGYSATSGDHPARASLCLEAIYLAEILNDLLPADPEIMGLLALMLLHDSRRDARTDNNGDLVTLEQQDRNLWDSQKIKAGTNLLNRAVKLELSGPYQLQAAISAEHARASHYDQTDWQIVTTLYTHLFNIHPSPVIALNRAVALSYAESPQAGLNAMKDLNACKEMERYQPYHAARADLLRRAGQTPQAAEAYRQALVHTTNNAETRFLERKIQELGDF